MSELVVLMGPPASGKTTYAHTLQQAGWHHLEVDTIREELGYPPGGGNLPTFTTAYRLAERLLATGQSVIFDSTAVTPTVRRQLRKLAKRQRTGVHLVIFTTDEQTCHARNQARSRTVPTDVLHQSHHDCAAQRSVALTEAWTTTRIVE